MPKLAAAISCAAIVLVVTPGAAWAEPMRAISAGGVHTCAVRVTGQALCWGWNKFGQLGASGFANRTAPGNVRGLTDATAVSVGTSSSCAIRSSGQAMCWGSEYVGDGTRASRRFPTPVKRLPDAVAITTNLFHSCAIRSGGRAVCWGGGGSLGVGPGLRDRRAPAAVRGVDDASAIGAGLFSTCALRFTGTVWCWGLNSEGEVGDGTTTRRWMPTMVHGLAGVSGIATGDYHACAVVSAPGQVFCWGDNEYGQLGDGTRTRRLTPVPVIGLDDAVALTASYGYTCAIRASREAVCWGDNESGQLGNGTRGGTMVPVAVHGLTDVAAIDAAATHACALHASGEPVCWGDNEYGQLGDGTRRARLVPTPVAPAVRDAGPKRPAVRARSRRCGDLARQVAFAVVSKGVTCSRAGRVIRRWNKTMPQRNGTGRVLGLYCRYRDLPRGAASVRCAGPRGRAVRWRTESIY